MLIYKRTFGNRWSNRTVTVVIDTNYYDAYEMLGLKTAYVNRSGWKNRLGPITNYLS
ncbi:MAG: hypothetical protein QOJ23_4816 [Actinomycetota bacterium]|jgi:hypothetical protein|nr:hypothetical protein [Actinomycetota bacterium]MDQ1500695.1 hypothetical protein [Actinomycetota bacterium]